MSHLITRTVATRVAGHKVFVTTVVDVSTDTLVSVGYEVRRNRPSWTRPTDFIDRFRAPAVVKHYAVLRD